MPRHSYHGSSYPTPDNTQPQKNNSQPNTLQSSQSSTNQIADSFLSDVTQGIYSDFSTLDNLSVNPAVQDSSDLAPHTPESLLYSPAPDVSLGNDPSSRKQREQPPVLRRSPRKLNNRTPQSQESLNNQHVNQDSSSNTEEKSMFSRMGIDRENRDINELRDLITKSNMILDSVHHSHKSQGVDDQMRDIEYLRERQKANAMGNRSLIHPRGVAKLGQRGRENGFPGSVDLVIANEISNTLLRQSEHYNKMASKFSNLKFIKIEPESEDEVEQPGIRRSSRKRTTANYSYPRYSYGGSSKRSRTRKRSRSFRKVSLSVPKDGGHVNFKAVNFSNERNQETDEPMHELSPVRSDEEFANDIQDDVDKNLFDSESQSNLYLKHDLRSRKIMLELLEGANENEETEETEEPVAEEPVAATSSNKAVRSKRLVKRSSTLKPTSKKSAKKVPKRKTSRKSITRKKNKDLDEADNEPDNDGEVPVISTSRGTRSVTIPKRKTTRRSTSRKKSEDLEWHPDNEMDESDNNNEAEVVTPITSTPQSTRSKRKTSRKSTSRKKNEDLEWHPDNEVDESDNDNEAEVVTHITSTPQGTRSKRKTSRRSTSRKKNEDLEWHPDDEVDESDDDNETEVVAPITSTPQSTRSKRKTSRKSTSRKKNEDLEWHPNDEVESESDDDNEVVLVAPVTPTPRSTRSSKTTNTPKMATMDITPEDSTARKPSSKKATPKTTKTPKITRKVRKPARVRGRGRVRGSRPKNRDTKYKYSEEEEETESEIEIAANSENQIAQESSDVEMDVVQDIEPNDGVVEEPVPTPTRPKRTRKNVKDPISEPVVRSTRGRGGSKRGGRKGINTHANDDLDNDVSSIHESSGKEETNVPDVQKIGSINPKKTTKSARGGKGKGRGGHVGGNTAINQPPVPTIDPDVVEISAGNPMALANAVRALAGQNYDIVQSPENIVDFNSNEEPRVPAFVKPHSLATRSTSLNSTPPPELQTKSLHTSSTLSWSNDHWHHLKVFYEETKNEFISSGKVVSGNEDVYREVTDKFFDVDINNRTFGEENLRMRIIALESADIEKGNEPSSSIQRRSSIGSNSSRSSRFSVSRYNKAYSNLQDGTSGTKRKRSESNATATEDNKEGKNEEYDNETEDKVSKRPRVEENVPSEASATSETNIPRSDSMLSKIWGLFSSGRSQPNTASSNEET